MKIFFTLTDGAGIRNFIHSDVLRYGGHHDIVLWTSPEIIPYVKSSGYAHIELPAYTSSVTIEILRSTITRAELLRNARKFKRPDYLFYIIRKKVTPWRVKIKNILAGVLGYIFSTDKGILFLRQRMRKEVEQSAYFQAACQTLQQHQPDVVVCTHQRSPEAIALVQAARFLKIPTASFIFSWDNLPKGTLMAEADHYFAWSEYMKAEILQYYPWVPQQTIHITGTPQFLPYFNQTNYTTRDSFAQTFGLDADASWICFSGDDELTSPHDQLYLRDLATAVKTLNESGSRIQIVFRPSPADVSTRYDDVLSDFSSIIKKVPPQWEAARGKNWGALIPLAGDYTLLCSVVQHCAAVFNVGSTMAIDFSILSKPSAYFRYNARQDTRWDILKVYRFVHFDTMKGLEPVYWLNTVHEIASLLNRIVSDAENKREVAKKWQEVIVVSPLDQADARLWSAINTLAQKN